MTVRKNYDASVRKYVRVVPRHAIRREGDEMARRPPPKLAKFRFTEDERNQLLGLCDKGLPVREIARRLDRSPRSVRRIRNAAAGS